MAKQNGNKMQTGSKVAKALDSMHRKAKSGAKKAHARHTGKKDCQCPDCR